MEGGGLSAAIFVMTLGRRVLLLTLRMGGSTHRNEVVAEKGKGGGKKNQKRTDVVGVGVKQDQKKKKKRDEESKTAVILERGIQGKQGRVYLL